MWSRTEVFNTQFPWQKVKRKQLGNTSWWGIELANIAVRPLEKQISHNEQRPRRWHGSLVSKPEKDLRPQFSLLAAICRTNWAVKMRLITAEKDTFHVLHLQPQKQRNSFLSLSLSLYFALEHPRITIPEWPYTAYTKGFLNQDHLLTFCKISMILLWWWENVIKMHFSTMKWS